MKINIAEKLPARAGKIKTVVPQAHGSSQTPELLAGFDRALPGHDVVHCRHCYLAPSPASGPAASQPLIGPGFGIPSLSAAVFAAATKKPILAVIKMNEQ
jgi:hypothetical protein